MTRVGDAEVRNLCGTIETKYSFGAGAAYGFVTMEKLLGGRDVLSTYVKMDVINTMKEIDFDEIKQSTFNATLGPSIRI